MASNQRQYITKEQIESLYLIGGLSLRETARKLGTNTDSLCKRMKEVGVKTRNLSESHIGHIPYNKGTNFQSNTGKTHFKKNHIPWNKGLTKKDDPRIKSNPFPKGNIPWNKGLTKENCDIYKKMSEERSSENHWLWKGGVSKSFCVDCGKKIQGRCKRCFSCRKKYYRGEISSSWKGGRSKIEKYIRSLPEYRKWRKSVFERDNYTCIKCGVRSKKGKKVYLEAHHNRFFSKILLDFMKKYNELDFMKDLKTLTNNVINYFPFWDINNGITLCVDCHRKNNLHVKI
uniref:Uncharacterized protein n=1 Tax=viral metagenome TaxID=1070528 RepID=A0A6M3KFA5_9ZZZZ